MTYPVSPSATASAAPPESPATCGTPHEAASTNTIPKPSCSSPPHRLRHSMANTSAQPYNGGRSALGMRPRKVTGASSSSERRRNRSSSRPPPAITNRSFGRTRARRATARIAVSKPLRGTSREMPTMTSASAASPKCSRAAERSLSLSGWNLSGSTPHGTTVIGSSRPAAWTASAAGYPPAAMMPSARRSV